MHGRVARPARRHLGERGGLGRVRGATARVHGRVGDDPVGRCSGRARGSRGVEPALVGRPRSADRGRCSSSIEPGERSMVADRGANARLDAGGPPARLEAAAVLVSGYLLLHGPTHEAAPAALGRAAGRFVAVEAASWPLRRGVRRRSVLPRRRRGRRTSILVNEREAEVADGPRGPATRSTRARRALPRRAASSAARGAVLSWSTGSSPQPTASRSTSSIRPAPATRSTGCCSPSLARGSSRARRCRRPVAPARASRASS